MEDSQSKMNATILYVEDNQLNQLVVKGMLTALGYKNILIAEDAEQAIHFLTDPQINIDLILMDIGLPGMNGIDLTEKIRHSQWTAKHVPIVALTGNEAGEAKAKSFAAGMNDFLVKPANMALLGFTLEKFLKRDPR